MELHKPQIIEPWWNLLWKIKEAPRTRLLMWSILFNKTQTGANLMKQSFQGSFWCHLCRNCGEDNNHIFLEWFITQELWNNIHTSFPSLCRWQGENIKEAWNNWRSATSRKERNLPLLTWWTIWIAKNHIIFQHKAPHWPSILSRILVDYHLIPDETTHLHNRNIKPEAIDTSIQWAYFDGSA